MSHQVSRMALIVGAALLGAVAGHAQVIDAETNETTFTSTANNGSPADVEITEDGSIEISQTPGARGIVVDSDNTVLNEGGIVIEDSDNAVGILIEAGRTSEIFNDGFIQLIEDYDREDTDDDDDLDGPVAIGTGRIGLLLQAGGAFNGNITNDFGSTIQVEGNDSAGIRLLSQLNGDLTLDGSVIVTGDQIVGVDITEALTGNFRLTSSVSVNGEDSIGVSLANGVGGGITLEGSVSASGFRSPGSTNYVAPANVTDDTDPLEERIDAEDLLTGGPAFALGGSVDDGFLINGRIDTFISEEDADDETKDTIEDFDENRGSGSITSTGSAPALLITPDWGVAASEDLVIGTVSETVRDTLDDDEDDDFTETLAVFEYDYSFINRGSISARGQNVGFDALSTNISGSQDGQFETILSGGFLNTGSISSSSFEANSTALLLGRGANIGQLVNDGSIAATMSTELATSVAALVIEDTATLSQLENNGSIRASSTGNSGSPTAIIDRSGTLNEILNTGQIVSQYLFDGIETEIAEDAIAIDLSQTFSPSDVTYVQRRAEPVDDLNGDDEIDEDDVAAASLVGAVFFGSGNDVFQIEDGVVIGNVDFGAGTNTMNVVDAEVDGDVLFSGASGAFNLGREAIYSGDLTFANGGNSFVLSDGAVFQGNIFNTGQALDLSVSASELRIERDTSVSLSSLTLSDGAVLEVEIDPAAPETVAIFDVAGVAQIGSDVLIRPVFETVSDTGFRQTVIIADFLQSDGVLDASALTQTRFLYNTDLVIIEDQRDQLDLVYTLKTPDELGLDPNQGAAYASVLSVFEGDDELGFALASVEDADQFFEIYNQLLPQRSEASTRFLAAQASGAFGALGDRLDLVGENAPPVVQYWAQEHYTVVDIDDGALSPGYNGDGFGVTFGADRTFGFIDRLGLMTTFTSGEFEEKTGGANPVSTTSYAVGLYAQQQVGPIEVRAATQIARTQFNSTRTIDIVVDLPDNENTDDPLDTEDVRTRVDGDWAGWSGAMTVSASSEFDAGAFYIRPEASLDYFYLSQDEYTEETDRYEELAVSVGSAQTDRLSVAAVTSFGARFRMGRGDELSFNPEVRLGYRSELTSTPYEATVRYLGSDKAFQIETLEEYGEAFISGLSLILNSERFTGRFSYDVEVLDTGFVHYAGLSAAYRF